jgi:hypothetical protein
MARPPKIRPQACLAIFSKLEQWKPVLQGEKLLYVRICRSPKIANKFNSANLLICRFAELVCERPSFAKKALELVKPSL